MPGEPATFRITVSGVSGCFISMLIHETRILKNVVTGVDMKVRYFWILAVLMTVIAASHAQTEPKARKFAEFGPMSQAGVKAKMGDFLKEMYKDPSCQGYIISYGTPKAIAARRRQITNSITFLRQDPLRLTFVDGGPEKTVRTVMWIVPAGAEPPTP